MENALTLTGHSTPTAGGDSGFRIPIRGDSCAPGRARREIERLGANLDSPVLDSVRLLVTELVTNSVRHAAAGEMELAVAVRPQHVHVEVVNPGDPFTPMPADARRSDNSGWGLFLIDSLSDDWGVAYESGVQRVWFDVSRA